jgi:hypothetical protein
MDDRSRLEYLAGQVAALNAFAMAVISTHSDLKALHATYARLVEDQIALFVT